MTYEKWVKDLIGKLPVFESKEEAVKAAIQANKKLKIHEVWKEPKERGGRYVVAAPEAFEVLYREKYKQVLDAGRITDIERGEDAEDIEEVEDVD